MNRKKLFSLIALLCIVIALIIYSTVKKGNAVQGFFWIPLVLSAVFLFAANRIK